MAGLLGINTGFGNQALGLYENTEIQNAQRTIYNDQNRKENEAAIGAQLMSAGKKGAASAKQTMKQYQNDQSLNSDMSDAAKTDPRDAKAMDQSGGSGMTGSQFANLFGTFFKGMMGSGGGSYGGAGGGAGGGGGGGGG